MTGTFTITQVNYAYEPCFGGYLKIEVLFINNYQLKSKRVTKVHISNNYSIRNNYKYAGDSIELSLYHKATNRVVTLRLFDFAKKLYSILDTEILLKVPDGITKVDQIEFLTLYEMPVTYRKNIDETSSYESKVTSELDGNALSGILDMLSKVTENNETISDAANKCKFITYDTILRPLFSKPAFAENAFSEYTNQLQDEVDADILDIVNNTLGNIAKQEDDFVTKPIKLL